MIHLRPTLLFLAYQTCISVSYSFNINHILDPFSNCLLHVINFQLFDLRKSQLSKGNFKIYTNQSDELTNSIHPVIYSKFDIIIKVETYQQKILRNGTLPYIFPPNLILYTCVLQLYLNVLLASDYHEGMFLHGDLVPDGLLDIIFHRVKCLKDDEEFFRIDEMCEYTLRTTGADEYLSTGINADNSMEKYGVYQLLFLDDIQKITFDIIDFWSISIDSVSSAVSNHFTKFIVSKNGTSGNFIFHALLENQNFRIFSENYTLATDTACGSCISEITERQIRFVKNITSQTMWTVANFNVDGKIFYKMRYRMDRYFAEMKEKPSFRNFELWMASDLVILYEMFSAKLDDYTIKRFKTDYAKYPTYGNVYFQHENAHRMPVIEEGIEFLTCGGIKQGFISLNGYISAFDSGIWVTAGTIILLTSLVFKCTSHSKGKSLDIYSLPFNALMEQSSRIAINIEKHNFLYFLSGAWILAALVLGNAYKGQNITALTQPLPLTKPELYQDLIDQRFSIYCKGIGGFLTSFFAKFEKFMREDSAEDVEIMSGNLLRNLLVTAESNKQVDKYRRILSIVRNFTIDEWKELKTDQMKTYVEKIKSCKDVAFMSWSKDIKESELILKLYLRKETKLSQRQIKDIVSRSKESIIKTKKGWTLNWVSLPLKFVISRISTMVESGIAKQWYNWEDWRKHKIYMKEILRFQTNDKFRAPNMYGNIAVLFYVHIVLVFGCFLVWIVERFLGSDHFPGLPFFHYLAKKIRNLVHKLRIKMNKCAVKSL